MEPNLFVTFSVTLRQHSTSILSDVPGALSLKINYVFCVSANQNRDHPCGPKSDWLSSTKETQGLPEFRSSLRFYFFFRETMIQGTKGPRFVKIIKIMV